MAKLEIDREDVNDRKKWRNNVNEEEVQHYRKTDYKPIIIIPQLFNCTAHPTDLTTVNLWNRPHETRQYEN